MGRLFGIVALILLIISGIIYWQYFYVFSEGMREGVLYKFSRKGNVFKTYEGEMQLPGVRTMTPNGLTSNNFYFSVSDQKLADSLEDAIGKSVKVHYNQYKKTLPWRGDNYGNKNSEPGQYVIDRIESVTTATTNTNF
jgi:hypothetical protein